MLDSFQFIDFGSIVTTFLATFLSTFFSLVVSLFFPA